MRAKQEENDYARLAQFFDDEIVKLVQQRNFLQRELNKEEVDFRFANQTRPTRREFDISDPELLAKSRPTRESDDQGFGPACAQKFAGEDLNAGPRRAAQLSQQKEWVRQQMAEKAAKGKAQLETDNEFAALLAAQKALAVMLEHEEVAQARGAKKAMSDFNRALAAQQEAAAAAQAAAELAMAEAEKAAAISSDFLAENPASGVSSFQAHRPRADHWKGHSEEEANAVFEERAAQRSQMKMNVYEAKLAAAKEAKRQAAMHAQVTLMTQAAEDANEAARKQLAADQMTQKAAKSDADSADKLAGSQNTFLPDFFNQFGRSHR